MNTSIVFKRLIPRREMVSIAMSEFPFPETDGILPDCMTCIFRHHDKQANKNVCMRFKSRDIYTGKEHNQECFSVYYNTCRGEYWMTDY
jgi:hypothetical protein